MRAVTLAALLVAGCGTPTALPADAGPDAPACTAPSPRKLDPFVASIAAFLDD